MFPCFVKFVCEEVADVKGDGALYDGGAEAGVLFASNAVEEVPDVLDRESECLMNDCGALCCMSTSLSSAATRRCTERRNCGETDEGTEPSSCVRCVRCMATMNSARKSVSSGGVIVSVMDEEERNEGSKGSGCA